MTMKDWERKVLAKPGAADRVADIEDELRLTLVYLRSSQTAELKASPHPKGTTSA